MTQSGETSPIRKRATDDNRAFTVDQLSLAVARGQLSLEEFEDRSTSAWATRYVDELSHLLADVSDEPQSQSFPPAALSNQESNYGAAHAIAQVRSHITGHQDGSTLSLSIIGGAERKGNWLCPNTHTSVAVMGGNLIDLRDALLESDRINIKVFTFMGGVEIIVPEGVRVICDGVGLMGGFGSEIHKSSTISPASLSPNAPIIRVTGLALLGGVSVVTKPRD